MNSSPAMAEDNKYMKKVYLDYAATTPVAPEVRKAMQPYFGRMFGNPMAMHSFGVEARRAIEEARERTADFFSVSAEEIVFTSGATESNNLALKGVVKAVRGYVERNADRFLIQPSRPTGTPPHLRRGKDEPGGSAIAEKQIAEKKGSSHPPSPEASSFAKAAADKSDGQRRLEPTHYFSSPQLRACPRLDRGGGHRAQSRGEGLFTPHIITTAFEHHCLLDSAKALDKELEAEVTFIKPTRDGLIKPSDISAAIKPNTVLVSVMYVNNEVGTIAPLSEIAELIKKERTRRKHLPIYFHSDITQGVNYLPCDISRLGVDLFSMSAHKIYGPKGTGALGVKKDVLIEKIQLGGEQEFNLRAGTQNVPGIVGMGAAVERIGQQIQMGRIGRMGHIKKVQELRDYFWKKLQEKVKDIRLNGSPEKRVANNLNVSFRGVEGESMLLALDMAGVACSTGSACSSESLEPSHVLLSLGLTHPEAHGSLRFTLGEGNTKADIDYAVGQIERVVEKLRRVSGYRTQNT